MEETKQAAGEGRSPFFFRQVSFPYAWSMTRRK
jgi:hypothetical protein